VAYVVRNGIEWRALPVDFPPWQAVYAFWERWNNRGLPHELVRRLRELLRVHQGRTAESAGADSRMIPFINRLLHLTGRCSACPEHSRRSQG
jgi:transposase